VSDAMNIRCIYGISNDDTSGLDNVPNGADSTKLQVTSFVDTHNSSQVSISMRKRFLGTVWTYPIQDMHVSR